MKKFEITPKKHGICNLPTRIERLDRLSKETGKNFFIKRDDQTGSEFGGNKVRKLEFAVNEAREKGADTLITCGGIQSNHCRATAAVGARLGFKVILFLRSDEKTAPDGNYLLDQLLGAEVRFITGVEYRDQREELMKAAAEERAGAGGKAYIIPEGASNRIGTYGYFEGLKEIVEQEETEGVVFDTIACAVGSGGTFAGLYISNLLNGFGKNIVGVNICDSSRYFEDVTKKLTGEFLLGEGLSLETVDFSRPANKIKIIDGYVGRGYALNTAEELEFIKEIATAEGVILDPVYTGKAMRGLVAEVKAGKNEFLQGAKNILFIHTGGVYGLFPKRFQF